MERNLDVFHLSVISRNSEDHRVLEMRIVIPGIEIRIGIFEMRDVFTTKKNRRTKGKTGKWESASISHLKC